MATYYAISLDEMTEFLVPQGFVVIDLPNCGEVVFGKIVAPRTCLRIYTGINRGNAQSRGVGEDAIRVSLFWKERTPQGDRIHRIGTSKRVHRVEGWCKNLQTRIDKWDEISSPFCPYCGAPMMERAPQRNPSAKFWGCATYPLCRTTLPFDTAIAV